MRDSYLLESDEEETTFEFVSDGSGGRYPIKIQYTHTNTRNVFNLGFGVCDGSKGLINDTIVINNRDTQKILNTVASSIYVFFHKHPHSSILIKGSTPARTRLYRMGITLNMHQISTDFKVYGYNNGRWNAFKRNKNYEAFLVQPKK